MAPDEERRGTHPASCSPVLARHARTVLLASAFPFQGFPGMGGGFGGAPPPTPIRRTPDVDYYAELELDAIDASEITEKEIKRQYRKLSRKYHPDATIRNDASSGEEDDEDGGDEGVHRRKSTGSSRSSSTSRGGGTGLSESMLKEKYIRIQKAYEALSDPQRRKMFDLQGEAGLEALEKYLEVEKDRESGGRRRAQDPLAAMLEQLGGGGGRNPFQATTKELSFNVPLVDVLTGSTKTIEIQKRCICKLCKGRGAPTSSPISKCHYCKGKGSVVMNMELAPGMHQQVLQPCPHCEGRGEIFKQQCPGCRAKGLTICHQRRTVEIPKGAEEGQSLTLPMDGDEEVGKVPGDLVLKLATTPHPTFARRPGLGQADLDTNLSITLPEALLGFRREFTHMDEKEKVVMEREQQVTPFGTVLKVAGKGLPFGKGRAGRGDLYVRVNCRLPSLLTSEQKEAITAAFQGKGEALQEKREEEEEHTGEDAPTVSPDLEYREPREEDL